ncbi:MAG TPA: hypothetical protein VFZ75_12130, partial [Actinomycetota bacterium]|nr:hypothetical protein [Actinomycetota bacterium]
EQIRSLQESGGLVPDRYARRRFVEGRGPEMPRTVERVLLARIDRLTATEKDVLVAASVLGREFDRDLLGRLTGEVTDVAGALDGLGAIDLIRPERLADQARFRFKHALIQEAAYGTLLKRRRRELHRKAADAIGSLYEGRLDQVAGILGRHLHEAGEPELAVPHLVAAGDRAREAFANEEALSWYARASDAVREIPDRANGDDWVDAEADLHVRRAGVLDLTGRFEEAREAYRRALGVVPAEDRVKVARVRTNAASVEISDHRYDDALAELDRAEEALAASRTAPPDHAEAMTAWLDIQDARMAVFYWVGDLEAYTELIDRVQPIVESRGTPLQRVEFFDSILTYRMRLERYVLSEETVEVARAALDAAERLGDDMRVAWSRFELGFALVWAGRPDEATDVLHATKLEADRMGDVVLRSRSLMYRLVAHRRRGDPTAVERAIDPVIEAARAASLPEYEAMAIANRSWVHGRNGRDSDAATDARAAVDLLRSLPIHYPFEWMALWPLLGVELRRGHTAEAVKCGRDMLDERQQPLPAELRANLEAAVEEWDDGRAEAALSALRSAVHLARRKAFV